MICNIKTPPVYIDDLNVDKNIKYLVRNIHNTIVNDLVNLELEDGTKVFSNREQMDSKKITTLNLNNKTGKQTSEILIKAKSVIDSINNKYINSVVLANYRSKKILIVNLTDYAKSLQKKKEDTANEFINFTGKLFNLNSHAEGVIQDSVRKNVLIFLDKLGVDVSEAAIMLDDVNPNAISDLLRKTVRFAKGHDNKLPEEAAHFLTMLLPKDHPVLTEAMNEIVKYPIYQQVVKEYGEIYNHDEIKLRHEAIGKLVASRVLDINKPVQLITKNLSLNDKALSWLQKIMLWFKNLLSDKINQKDDVFDNLVNRLLTGNVSDLSFENVKDLANADGLFFNKTMYEEIVDKIESSPEKQEIFDKLKLVHANLSVLKKLVDRSDNQSVFTDKTKTQRVISFMKSVISNMDNTSLNMTNSFASTVIHTKEMLEYYRKSVPAIKAIKDKNAKLLQVHTLDQAVKVLTQNILPIINQITYYLDDSDAFSNLISSIDRDANYLTEFIKDSYFNTTEEILVKRFEERSQALTQELNDEIAKQEVKKASLPLEKDKKTIDKKIQQLKESHDRNNPSRELINAYLKGLRGDSSGVDYILVAASMNSNLLISELSDYIQNDILNQYELTQSILNKAQDAVDAYEKETGLSKTNTESFNEGLIEEVTIFESFDKDGKAIYRKQKALISEHDQSYKTILAEKNFKIRQLNYQKQNETDANKREELEKEFLAAFNDLKNWKLENLEQKYTEPYLKIEQLLDEDLGNGLTTRRYTEDIYLELKTQHSALKISKDFTTTNAILSRIDELNHKLKELRKEYNKTGDDLLVAKQLNKYSKEMNKMISWELTDESYANQEYFLNLIQSQLANNQISQEVHDVLEERAYSVEYSKEYWEEKDRLSKVLQNLIETYVKDTETNNLVKESISELYSEIEQIAKPYRNHTGTIDPTQVSDLSLTSMSDEDVLKIKSLQDKINLYKKELVKLSGYSQKDIERMSYLYNILADPSLTAQEQDSYKKEYEKLRLKGTKNKIAPTIKKNIVETMIKLKALTDSDVTDFYQQKREEIKSGITPILINREEPIIFNEESYFYNHTDNTWSNNQGITVDTSVIENYQNDLNREEQLKETEWFKNNHILNTYFVLDGFQEVHEPLYIWKKTKPANPAYITKVPAFRFKERVVKNEFINPHYQSTVDGSLVPKKGKFVNEKFNNLSPAKRKYLKFWTDLHLNFQEALLPSGKRIGLLLPSIEKSTFDKAADVTMQGVSDSTKKIFSSVSRFFTATTTDSNENRANFTDGLLKEIPVLFSGKIDADKQSSDIASSVLTYVHHLIKYKSLNDTKPLADALLSIAETNKPVTAPSKVFIKIQKVSNLFTPNSEEIQKKAGQSIFEKHIRELINKIYYNENEYDEKIGNFDVGKAMNTITGVAANMMLGGRTVSNFKNNLSGKIQIGLTSKLLENKVYTPTAFKDAQLETFGVLKDMCSDFYKAGNTKLSVQILNKFDCFQGEFMNNYGHKISLTGVKYGSNVMNLLMGVKNIAETEMQIVNCLAVLKSVTIEHDGKQIKLLDCFELKNGLIRPKFEIKQYVIDNARARVKYANIITNGNFNKMDKTTAEKSALGRSGLFLNKYFIPMTMHRYAGEKYNSGINAITTGYQRQMVNIFLDEIRNGYIPGTSPSLTEDEKRIYWTNLYETGVLLSLFLAYSLLGGDDPDKFKKLKKDPNGYWKAQLLTLILSINIETQTLHPIAGFGNIVQKLKSPFPVIRVFENLAKFLATLNGGEDDFYQKDTPLYDKGDWKGIAAILKLTGIEGSYVELFNSIEKLKRVEQSQYIRL